MRERNTAFQSSQQCFDTDGGDLKSDAIPRLRTKKLHSLRLKHESQKCTPSNSTSAAVHDIQPAIAASSWSAKGHTSQKQEHLMPLQQQDATQPAVFPSDVHLLLEPQEVGCGEIQCRVPPNDNDVLLGKCRHAHNHAGNALYRNLIQEHHVNYQKATKHLDKVVFIRAVMDEVANAGGRFLKFNEKNLSWQVLGPTEAHTKVSHALRNCKQQKASRKYRLQRSWGSNQRGLPNLDPLGSSVNIEPVPIGGPLPTFTDGDLHLLLKLFG